MSESQQESSKKSKPGSLRDRIAAFESKSTTTPSSPPPIPRAKPGHVSAWKAQPPSPTPPTTEGTAGGGMSASDAKESIGKAGSLKERMAALQGKGAFGMPGGASRPPPKPAGEKPRWKPPPKIPTAADAEDGADVAAARRSPSPSVSRQGPVRRPSEDQQPSSPPPSASDTPTGEEGDDVEEQERQKKAAITARMARLGGAKIGMMAPPLLAPKPIVKKSDTAAQDMAKEECKSHDGDPAVAISPSIPVDDSIVQVPTTADNAAAQDKPSPARTPLSMPVPAVPRRAGPPRKKASPSTKMPSPPTAPDEESVPASQESDHAPTSKTEERQVEANLEDVTEDRTDVQGDNAIAEELLPVEEKAKDVREAVEDMHAGKEEVSLPAPTTAALVPKPETGEDSEVSLSKQHRDEGIKSTDFAVAPAAAEQEDEPILSMIEGSMSPESQPVTPDQMGKDHNVSPRVELDPSAFVAEPLATEPNPDQENEDDEMARRKRVAERLAKMGAVNPLASASVRRASMDVGQESRAPNIPVRRQSTDSGKRASGSYRVESSGGRQGSVGSLAPVSPRSQEPLSPLSESGLVATDASLETSDAPESGPSSAEHESVSETEEAVPTAADDVQGLMESTPEHQEDDDDRMHHETMEDEMREESIANEEIDLEEVEAVPEPLPPPPMPPVPRPLPALPLHASRPNVQSAVPRMIPPPLLSVVKSEPKVEDDEPISRTEEGRSEDDMSEDDRDKMEEDRSLLSPRPPPHGRPSLQEGENRRSLPPPVPSPISPTMNDPSVQYVEILAESEGDPIDPTFHTPSRRHSPVRSSAPALMPEGEVEEEPDRMRRQTIAERMAKLGGITFGGPPPPMTRPAPRTQEGTQDVAVEEQPENEEGMTEEEEERARKQRIAAKLAGMGGMRFGMLPPTLAAASSKPVPERVGSGDSGIASLPQTPVHPPAPQRAPPAQASQSVVREPEEVEQDSVSTSDDGVKVEADESELEEVSYEEARQAQAPPSVPTRASKPSPALPSPRFSGPPPQRSQPPVPVGRPPVPTGMPMRRSSAQLAGSSTSSTQPTYPPKPSPSDYVMVDEPSGFDSESMSPPPPPPRSARLPPVRSAPPLPQPAPQEMSDSMQWELPSIPSAALSFSGNTPDLSLSFSEGSAAYSKATSSQRSAPSREPSVPSQQIEIQLSPEELMAIWGKVGVHVCEVALACYEKSKKSLVGDGSYAGFIRAVLSQVPNAAPAPVPSGGDSHGYGYLIYAQSGMAVQRRVCEIMPGDVAVLVDAKLKGHKGLQSYHQHVGAMEAVVGIVSEFDPKKSKVKVFQANQHVGQQTVETVSYRLEDMKSGSIKVFRVLEM